MEVKAARIALRLFTLNNNFKSGKINCEEYLHQYINLFFGLEHKFKKPPLKIELIYKHNCPILKGTPLQKLKTEFITDYKERLFKEGLFVTIIDNLNQKTKIMTTKKYDKTIEILKKRLADKGYEFNES